MYVMICWKTKDTKEGTIHVSNRMTVKEAMTMYKEEIESHAIEAYLRHFDGWHRRIYKRLKDKSNNQIEPTSRKAAHPGR